jgi:hypothetical protein
MDLTAAESVIGNELDGRAAEQDWGCIGNLVRSEHIDNEKKEEDVVIINSFDGEDDEGAADVERYLIKRRGQIASSKRKAYWNKIQQFSGPMFINNSNVDITTTTAGYSVPSEYERRKEILEKHINMQKTALAATAKERKAKSKRAYNAAYTALNTESKRAYNAAYAAMNTESKQAYNAAYTAKNTESKRAYNATYTAKTSESKRAYNAAYTAKNTESKRAYNAAYTAMINAKLHAYQQLMTSRTLIDAVDGDDQEEEKEVLVVGGADNTAVEVGDDSEEVAAAKEETVMRVLVREEGIPILEPKQVAESRYNNAAYTAMNTESKQPSYNTAYTAKNTESKRAYNATYTAKTSESKRAYNAAYNAASNKFLV